MRINRQDIEKLRVLINSGPRKIVIVSHTNPDGDAIGSSLAWGSFLRAKGHDVMCVVPNRYPYFLEWMEGISGLKIFKEDANGSIAGKIGDAEIIFCMDFNMVARLEGLGDAIVRNTSAVCVLIDHHLDPPSEFDLAFSYYESCSTSFLVYKLISKLDGHNVIDYQMAESLFVGIMTDTGNFSFSFLTPELFEAVAVLVRKGVDVPEVHTKVYNSFTYERVKLLGYVLNNMDTVEAFGNRVAYISLRETEMRRFNFQQGDSEGFVNYPLTVRDISMSAIFIETRHFIRVSLRSRGDVDVNTFARLYFEGGGHKNASGGKSYRSISATVEYFKKCVGEFFSGEGADKE